MEPYGAATSLLMPQEYCWSNNMELFRGLHEDELNNFQNTFLYFKNTDILCGRTATPNLFGTTDRFPGGWGVLGGVTKGRRWSSYEFHCTSVDGDGGRGEGVGTGEEAGGGAQGSLACSRFLGGRRPQLACDGDSCRMQNLYVFLLKKIVKNVTPVRLYACEGC